MTDQTSNIEPIVKAPSIKGHEKKIKEINVRLDALESKAPTTNHANQSELTDSTLTGRIERLEQCIAKMAHFNGGANERILREFGIDTYTLKAKDMSRMA